MIQSHVDKLRAEKDAEYRRRSEWAVWRAANCRFHRACREYRRHYRIPEPESKNDLRPQGQRAQHKPASNNKSSSGKNRRSMDRNKITVT